jgi:flavin reductase (DIM6/NTAB) family NADH-FMN oxidoreductase RutF
VADDQAFDALVGSMDHAMLIVTTVADDRRAGCLVGFHSQCSIEPRRYAVWISKVNETYEIAAAAEWFAVHLPRRDRHELAELFGGRSGDDIDKFERCGWTPGPAGVPVLDDCPDRFVGRRVELSDVGADHVCVVLAPHHVERGPLGASGWLSFDDTKDIVPGHPA